MNKYALYIHTDDIAPEIHSFNTVKEAYDYSIQVCREYEIELENEHPFIDDGGFYMSGDAGYATFECCPIIAH